MFIGFHADVSENRKTRHSSSFSHFRVSGKPMTVYILIMD